MKHTSGKRTRNLLASSFLGGAIAAWMFGVVGVALAQGNDSLKGQSITVLLPSPGYPADRLAEFEKATGIKVDQQTLSWDNLRPRIVTALVAGRAPADVIELDWSWVGQFGAANWLLPLDNVLDKNLTANVAVTPIFKYNGKLVAAPYNNDFKMMVFNKDHLAKAGITKAPLTMDELLADGRLLKQKGIVKYPFGLPLSVGEATSTAWFLLTMMYGGDLFDANMKPAFTDPSSGGYKALAFIRQALDEGLIDPAATGFGNPEVRQVFKAGDISFILSDGPGPLPTYNDPKQSKVAGNAAGSVVPNVTGKTRTYGLPEGLGIPMAGTEKKAAKVFVSWMMEPEHQTAIYLEKGTLPTQMASLEELNKEGKLQSGDALLAQLKGVGPLFADGTPSWYPEFSTATASSINELAKGQISVADTAKAIADAANKAMSGN
jgi:multiple sugar transport system substrate-binding protein